LSIFHRPRTRYYCLDLSSPNSPPEYGRKVRAQRRGRTRNANSPPPFCCPNSPSLFYYVPVQGFSRENTSRGGNNARLQGQAPQVTDCLIFHKFRPRPCPLRKTPRYTQPFRILAKATEHSSSATQVFPPILVAWKGLTARRPTAPLNIAAPPLWRPRARPSRHFRRNYDISRS